MDACIRFCALTDEEPVSYFQVLTHTALFAKRSLSEMVYLLTFVMSPALNNLGQL
jgi:hypothetical protein